MENKRKKKKKDNFQYCLKIIVSVGREQRGVQTKRDTPKKNRETKTALIPNVTCLSCRLFIKKRQDCARLQDTIIINVIIIFP